MHEYLEPNFRDDFNYPSLNRRDLMSLDTIKEKDFPRKKINQINSKRNWSINLYNLDIDKSYPRKRDVYLNKVDFVNKIDDIEKARPAKERILNKPDYLFNVRDIEKAYPRKERQFYGKNYFNNKNAENKILTPQYPLQNNYNKNFNNNNLVNNNENFKGQISNYSLNDRYKHNDLLYKNEYNNKNYNNFNNNVNNDRYNRYNNKYNDYHYDRDINKIMLNEYKNNLNTINKNNICLYKNKKKNNLSKSSEKIRMTPLDIHHILQNQKDYKDTIHDIFNNYPNYIDDSKPDNYLLNHHHDLIIGTPNKNSRLDVMMNKSNKLLSYDFSSKINLNDYNRRNKYNFMNTDDSVKINRKIPLEFKNQGLEPLYKELDNYKPKTYEQHLDSFTQNF